MLVYEYGASKVGGRGAIESFSRCRNNRNRTGIAAFADYGLQLGMLVIYRKMLLKFPLMYDEANYNSRQHL